VTKSKKVSKKGKSSKKKYVKNEDDSDDDENEEEIESSAEKLSKSFIIDCIILICFKNLNQQSYKAVE